MTTGDRGRAVANRLEVGLRAVGVADHALPRLRRALEAALDRRRSYLRDPNHPDFLHTARTALVLLHDTPLTDTDALAAALLFDSEEPPLTFGEEEAAAVIGPSAASILASLPGPAQAGDALLEQLVTLPVGSQLVALAERLDHARHLHLRSTEHWPRFHADIEAVYLPLADRSDETLARRFRWWAQLFARRYL